VIGAIFITGGKKQWLFLANFTFVFNRERPATITSAWNTETLFFWLIQKNTRGRFKKWIKIVSVVLCNS